MSSLGELSYWVVAGIFVMVFIYYAWEFGKKLKEKRDKETGGKKGGVF